LAQRVRASISPSVRISLAGRDDDGLARPVDGVVHPVGDVRHAGRLQPFDARLREIEVAVVRGHDGIAGHLLAQFVDGFDPALDDRVGVDGPVGPREPRRPRRAMSAPREVSGTGMSPAAGRWGRSANTMASASARANSAEPRTNGHRRARRLRETVVFF
jgi:hypothetical protein